MTFLKEYENLYEIYRKIWNKKWILLLILAVASIVLCAVLFSSDMDIFFSFFVFIVVVVISTLLIYFISWNQTKKALLRFTPEELARINSDLPISVTQEGFCVTRDAVIYSKGKLMLHRVADVVWIYKQVTKHKMYGIITVGHSSAVVIADKHHKRYQYAIKNNSDTVEFLQTSLVAQHKGIFCGYNPDIARMFLWKFDEFLALCEQYEQQARLDNQI